MNRSSEEFTVDLVRHSASDYNNYTELEQIHADPNQYVNFTSQVPDITLQGCDLARTSAREYVATVDPKQDMVVIITSLEMRAYQTAQIYLQMLENHQVEILDNIPGELREKPYPVGINLVATAKYASTSAPIIIDHRLIPHAIVSLDYRTMWQQDMLEPIVGGNTTFVGLNETKLSSADLARFQAARLIIEQEADRASSWGDNYVKFEGRDYPFDVIPTAVKNMERVLAGLNHLRTLQNSPMVKDFENDKGKRIRYLLLTHEENMLHFVRSHFSNSRIANCERMSLHLMLDPKVLTLATYRGKTAKVLTTW